MQLIELSVGVPSKQALKHFLQFEVSPIFPSFTAIEGSGYWQGKREDCALIRLYVANKRNADYRNACRLAAVYCQRTREDCVLVTCTAVERAELINAVGEVNSL